MKTMTRIVLVVLALSFILAGCSPRKGAAAASPGAPGAKDADPPARGAIVYLEGAVKVDGAAATIGQELGAVALVETGPNATCEIVFNGKNALRVGQNAVASLDFSGIIKQVSLKKGGLTSVLRKLERVAGKDGFRVVTPTAVAAVRGTSFCIWVDEKSTYVCACNGSVRTVDGKGSNEQDLSAAHHVARNYVKSGEAISVSPAGIEHHSDASVESLAARIGEKVDWTKED
jgi:hypothetical protein